MGNSPPPTGWQTIGYDDSSWPAAVDTLSSPPPELTIWTSSPPLAAGEEILDRKDFMLSAGHVSACTLNIAVAGAVIEIYLNGTLISGGFSGFPASRSITVDPTLLLPGLKNVLAFHCSAATSALHGGQFAYDLDIS